MDNYRQTGSYKSYEGNYMIISQISNSFIFGQFFYKGQYVSGSCDAWQEYTNLKLDLPYDDLYFSSITAYSNIYDYRTNSPRSILTTCPVRNQNQINQLVSALISGRPYEFNCNSVSYRVFSCQGQRIFCLNCKQNCVPTLECPGNGLLVNSCISTTIPACSAVHASMGTTISLQYSQPMGMLKIILEKI
jgi:hypothetical protein